MIQLHIFAICKSKRDIRLFPSISIQILVNFYAPDRPSARMKCDYAIANVRDFWRCHNEILQLTWQQQFFFFFRGIGIFTVQSINKSAWVH